MTNRLDWRVPIFVLLLLVVGCGASASSPKGGYAQSPGAPMDAVATADGDDEKVMLEAEEAPAPPEPAAEAEYSGGAAAPAREMRSPVMKPAPAKPKTETADRAEQPSAGQGSTSTPGPSPDRASGPKVAAQMLVYTADLRIRVREVSKAIDAVEKLARERGGYLVVREDNSITVRVPSAKFDPVLDELARLGDLVHRNVSVEDVTDLYFDMQTRMKNLEVMKARLEELLAKAQTVEESLAVQRQLERVTVELERLRGKLKLLAELVMFSTITVVFEPMSTEYLESKVRLPFPWMDQLGLGALLRL